MDRRTCINPHYRLQRELKVMERMHVHRGNIEEQIHWVSKWSPKERIYTCGECPSYNRCKFVNRYGIKEDRKSI